MCVSEYLSIEVGQTGQDAQIALVMRKVGCPAHRDRPGQPGTAGQWDACGLPNRLPQGYIHVVGSGRTATFRAPHSLAGVGGLWFMAALLVHCTQHTSPTNNVLTGADLLAKVADLGQQPRDVLAIACGYVRKNGKANIGGFSDALMTAHGIALPPVKRPAPSKGKPLSWNVAVSKTGVIPISAGYAALIGVEYGHRVNITHNPATGTLTLSKASTGPTEAPAEDPAGEGAEADAEASTDAPVVVTITEPAAALEGALAPF